MKTNLRTAPKTCKKCAYFNKNDCAYVASNGTRDKGGNPTNLNFDMHHNCRDWHPVAS